VTNPDQRETTTDRTDEARSVVVGVDGSERNRSAVAYAVHEAADSGRALTLLAVLDDFAIPIPHHSLLPDDERDWQVLNEIAEATRQDHPELTVHRDVRFGGAVSTLLDRSDDQELLVVGKRGLGAFSRLMVGSTSIGVAGRSKVPVIVVPDGWQQAEHVSDAVVVGLDPEDTNDATLRFAFTVAHRRGVALTVAYAIDISPLLAWDVELGSPAYWADRAVQDLETALAPLRAEFPDVSVSVREVRGHPATVLLDESGPAQLLVLGRHHDSRIGFSLGSVARGVLHYAEVPVAVVPSL